MNPLLTQALASILRHLFGAAAAYLVARGIWTEEDAMSYVAALALGVIAIGWSVYQKYVSQTKLVTALASGTIMSEAKLEEGIAKGIAASPATPKTATPQTGTGGY